MLSIDDILKKKNFKYSGVPKTRLWCPARSCKFNKDFRCMSHVAKLRLYSDGRFKCMTYSKRAGFPRKLDYFDKETQDAFIEEMREGKRKAGIEKNLSATEVGEMPEKASETPPDALEYADDEIDSQRKKVLQALSNGP